LNTGCKEISRRREQVKEGEKAGEQVGKSVSSREAVT